MGVGVGAGKYPVAILGAGRSERMGFPKIKMGLNGRPVLEIMVERLVEADWELGAVLVGNEELAQWVLGVVREGAVIVNPDPGGGMISSLRLALMNMSPMAAGFLSWPVDRPLISVGTLKAMRWVADRSNVVVPTCHGRRGHPTWWGKESWELLQGRGADKGANRILQGAAVNFLSVPVEDENVLVNIDTPDAAVKCGLGELVEISHNPVGDG